MNGVSLIQISVIVSNCANKCKFDVHNKVHDWIYQNTNKLQKKKTEGSDEKSVSSVSVPRTELFSEPFLKDLDLIWRINSHDKIFNIKDSSKKHYRGGFNPNMFMVIYFLISIFIETQLDSTSFNI
jgi:hypothetical protein